MEWIKTDDWQFVKKVDEDNFIVLDVKGAPTGGYRLEEIDVNIKDYENELEDVINGYYDSVDIVKETYGDDWKQIIAEIIAEKTEHSGGLVLKTKKELTEAFKKQHNLTIEHKKREKVETVKPLICPLCEHGHLEHDALDSTPNGRDNKTHIWICDHCPAVLLEFWENSDADAMHKRLTKGN